MPKDYILKSSEEYKKMTPDELSEEVWIFKSKYIKSLSDEDEVEEIWDCLLSSVESGHIKYDDLPDYGFDYLHK